MDSTFILESAEGEKTLKSSSETQVLLSPSASAKNLSFYCFASISDEKFGAIGSIEVKSEKLKLSKRSLPKVPDEGQMDNLTS